MTERDQTIKADAGKIRPTLVSTDAIRSMAKIEEIDQKAEARLIPELIHKTKKVGHGWKGLFECPYCGKHFEAYISNVAGGRQHSCGCMKSAFMVESKGTHGDSKSRLYRIYSHILDRCNNPKCKEYKWYGAKGIKCEFADYNEFKEFAMTHGYNDNLTVERVDVNDNYSADNVIFIPLNLQARNTTRSVKITYKDLTLSAAEWAEILGFRQDTLTKRKRSGWSDERTLEKQVGDSIDITLIPIEAIKALRETRLYGLQKYGSAESWHDVEIERYRDALCRHILAYLDDPDGVDEESGLPHIYHVITNCAFLCELEKEKHEKCQKGKRR